MAYLIVSAVVVVAAVLVVLLLRLSRAAEEAQKLLAQINAMTPRLDRILAETEAELGELRQVTQKVNGIADHALAITQKAASTAIPVLNAAGSLSKPLSYVTAAITGVQAVMKMFKQRREQQSAEDSEEAAHEVPMNPSDGFVQRPEYESQP